MIVYDNGDRLQHKDSAAVEQTVATWEDLGGYAFADLRTPLAVKPNGGWVTVPLSLVSGVGASVSGDHIRLTQPGVWFINSQVNVNGFNANGVIYSLISGTYSGGSNYAGFALDGSGKRFGAPTNSMAISDGTGAVFVQVQVGGSGAQSPQVNAANVQCRCVHPMSVQAARDLLASLPPEERL